MQQSARRGRKNQVYSSCLEHAFMIWFRSANSHTGPQLQSLHQRPDRWQHPTTCQCSSKTACVSRGVHRWALLVKQENYKTPVAAKA